MAALERLPKSSRVRCLLLDGNNGRPGFTLSVARLEQLPAGTCQIDIGFNSFRNRPGGFGDFGRGSQLYDCAGRASR